MMPEEKSPPPSGWMAWCASAREEQQATGQKKAGGHLVHEEPRHAD
jgi:hypothetical protein